MKIDEKSSKNWANRKYKKTWYQNKNRLHEWCENARSRHENRRLKASLKFELNRARKFPESTAEKQKETRKLNIGTNWSKINKIQSSSKVASHNWARKFRSKTRFE